MPASAYHLFKALYDTKSNLSNSDKSLEKYTLPDSVVATYGGKGQFPDMILRRNGGNGLAGGEMIEIKEAKDSYNITSFNSTVPSAKKRLSEVVVKGGRIYKALIKAGEKDPFSLDEREVYYLLRGFKKGKTKVCLVHGAFFETVAARELIVDALRQSVKEAAKDSPDVDAAAVRRAWRHLAKLDWRQRHLATTRKMSGASVSLRFRVMAAAAAEANILNGEQYPDIGDNTLNMATAHDPADANRYLAAAFGGKTPADIKRFVMPHALAGRFVVFQTPL